MLTSWAESGEGTERVQQSKPQSQSCQEINVEAYSRLTIISLKI